MVNSVTEMVCYVRVCLPGSEGEELRQRSEEVVSIVTSEALRF